MCTNNAASGWHFAHARHGELWRRRRGRRRYADVNAELDRLLDETRWGRDLCPGIDIPDSPRPGGRLKSGALQKFGTEFTAVAQMTDALRLRGLDLATGTTDPGVPGYRSGGIRLRHRSRRTESARAQPRRAGDCDSTAGLVVHRRDGRAAGLDDGRGRGTAGDRARMDGHRGGARAAPAPRTGDTGRRAAQRHVQSRRTASGDRAAFRAAWRRQRHGSYSSWPRRWLSRRWRARPGWSCSTAGCRRRCCNTRSWTCSGRTWRLDFAWPESTRCRRVRRRRLAQRAGGVSTGTAGGPRRS